MNAAFSTLVAAKVRDMRAASALCCTSAYSGTM